jgi:hypothetical protein
MPNSELAAFTQQPNLFISYLFINKPLNHLYALDTEFIHNTTCFDYYVVIRCLYALYILLHKMTTFACTVIL